jgi:hypothetical protein
MEDNRLYNLFLAKLEKLCGGRLPQTDKELAAALDVEGFFEFRDRYRANQAKNGGLPWESRVAHAVQQELLRLPTAPQQSEQPVCARADCQTGAIAENHGVASSQPTQKEPEVEFPGRAKWLDDYLREHHLTPAALRKRGAPDRKTLKKILRGKKVTDGVLEKLAASLSRKGFAPITTEDIPQH